MRQNKNTEILLSSKCFNEVTWSRTSWGLLALLIVSFILRIANLRWGIPITKFSSFYHADEVKMWGSTVDFPGNYLVSTNYLYGTAVQYLIGILMIPVKFIYFSFCNGDHDGYVIITIIVIRFCVAAMGTSTIYLIYLLGQNLYSKKVGLFGAVFLTFSPFHCFNSSLTTLDVPMGFLLVVCFLLMLRIRTAENFQFRNIVYLGIASGLLMGTKITGVLFIPVPIIFLSIDWIFQRREGNRKKPDLSDLLRSIVFYVLIAVTCFAITTPHALLSFGDYITFMKNQKHNWYDRGETNLTGIFSIWFHSTTLATGYVVAILAPFSIMVLRNPLIFFKWAIPIFCFVYYLFWQDYLPARFVLFITPLLCLQASVFCKYIEEVTLRHLGKFLVFVSCCFSLVQCLEGINHKWNDSRTVAAIYIDSEYSNGTQIGIATDSHAYTWRHHQWRYPKIDFHQFTEVNFLDRPEIIITTSYEINQFKQALKSEKLLKGFIWDPDHKGEWYKHQPPSPEVFRFFEELITNESYQLDKVFKSPYRLEIIGQSPDIYIYSKRVER